MQFINSIHSKVRWNYAPVWRGIFIVHFIFLLFYNTPIQTLSLPNRTAWKVPGISGQSSVQSLMGQNSKARNISGFHIMEVMINMWGYTSSLPINNMFWSDCNDVYCSMLAGYFFSSRGGQELAWKKILLPGAKHCCPEDTGCMGQETALQQYVLGCFL